VEPARGQHGQEGHVGHAEQGEHGRCSHHPAEQGGAPGSGEPRADIGHQAPRASPACGRDVGDDHPEHRDRGKIGDGQAGEAGSGPGDRVEHPRDGRPHQAADAHRRGGERHGVHHQFPADQVSDQRLAGGEVDGRAAPKDDRDHHDGPEAEMTGRGQDCQGCRPEAQGRLGDQEDAAPRVAIGKRPPEHGQCQGGEARCRGHERHRVNAPGLRVDEVAERHRLHPSAEKDRPLRRPVPAVAPNPQRRGQPAGARPIPRQREGRLHPRDSPRFAARGGGWGSAPGLAGARMPSGGH
jgi:hypothetical protein